MLPNFHGTLFSNTKPSTSSPKSHESKLQTNPKHNYPIRQKGKKFLPNPGNFKKMETYSAWLFAHTIHIRRYDHSAGFFGLMAVAVTMHRRLHWQERMEAVVSPPMAGTDSAHAEQQNSVPGLLVEHSPVLAQGRARYVAPQRGVMCNSDTWVGNAPLKMGCAREVKYLKLTLSSLYAKGTRTQPSSKNLCP